MRACRFNPTALGYFRFGGVCSIRLIAAATKQLWCSSSVPEYPWALAACSPHCRAMPKHAMCRLRRSSSTPTEGSTVHEPCIRHFTGP